MRKSFDWIENRLAFLWKRAEDSTEVDDQSLATLRILYGLFIVTVMTPSVSWVGALPQSLFLPPVLSLASLFDGFPGTSWLLLVDVSLVVLTLCILFGVWARRTGVLFAVVYLVGQSFVFSFGKVDHGIMFPVFVFGLSLTNWGVGYALVPEKRVSRRRQRTVLAALAVTLCFAFLTAGAQKALHWVDLDVARGGFLSWFYQGYFGLGRDYLLAPLVLRFRPQLFEVFDYLAVAFELSPFIALLAGRRWWLTWLLIACMFHLSTLALLNISFVSHAVIYLSFISLRAPFVEAIQKRVARVGIIPFASVVTAFIAVHYWCQLLATGALRPLSVYARPLAESDVALELYVGLLVWVAAVVSVGAALVRALADRGSGSTLLHGSG